MKRLFNLVSLALCASLLGCAASGPFKSKMEPDPVMAGLDEKIDVSEHVKLSLDQNCAKLGAALQGNVKISEHGRLAVYAHCATLCDAQIEAKDATGKTTVCGGEVGNPWLAKVADQSFMLITQGCNDWFSAMEKQRREIQYNQTNANSAIGVVSAVLAAASGGSHNRSIFNLASATTLGNAFVENYKASFLFSPELERLRGIINNELLFEKKNDITSKITSGTYKSFAQLAPEINEFESLCKPAKIEEVIKKSLNISKFSLTPIGISVESQNTANALKAALGLENSSDAELMGLAALAEFPLAQRAKAIQFLENKVDDKTQAVINDGKENGPLTTLVRNVKTLKLDTSDEHVRNLQRLADVLKWDSNDAFNQRKTLVENWALKAPNAKPAGAEDVARPAQAANATPALRNNRPPRNSFVPPAIQPPTEPATNNTTASRSTAIDREMSKVFGKNPSAPVQKLSTQIVATPK